ncbi:uncharacterized protein CXorf21 [Chanos chanos]|uniref:Uncharacterized protein CXorf21 n=1 Tax=Chanos chanos TaxID=29144 RepID=A0A6J2WI20_CHACN|nr:uncharacterized protein CXorf21-like [Chanos chanos]
MLCESRLWSLILCQDSDHMDPPPTLYSDIAPKTSPLPNYSSTQTPLLSHSPSSPSSPSEISQPRQGDPRSFSHSVEIPGRAGSGGPEAFLVPSSCHSICQHYSDLHIAGGQVLPLSPNTGDLPCYHSQDLQPGPFLMSRDVPPPSLPPPPAAGGGGEGGSRRWREGSGRERQSLLQLGRPLSNSQLNSYLEQKLLELYKQYLTEGPADPRPVMASELLQTSLDQITLQLSREQNLETSRAKDMVLSCLLRVTSAQQSSEIITTPLLQISTDTN